jgi:enoyl-CoA hydratase/carnithine racemase
MQVEADEILTPFDGAEAQEGVRAFLEKRPATFS